ncbi:ketopantoate reductase family protein [Limosilactobacillus sp. STM2_1]|uniref:2-dehydropantoate 2-reductase n=1 Tax=Limosilactobacillus rudii TaxID=2759755 RepID=A0A7W3YPI2_9LACO|nr:ketopantoate reductase family protein [Limosilactobacillus rudii]MBB1080376.1 ketopantoate reductase family protein [Limosilactobacillus rudii]MBB1098402.1 ketopantoate reductase family protein [Limosilactobacillus rudii]MCD7135410.1 ketopantoate reductase family protein [Limosilactobacillus rudii]
MTLKYTVLGAGAMGLRFGVLLQELAGAQVDFVDNWDPQVETIKKQGGVYVSRDHENRHLVPVDIYSPEEYQGDPDVFIVFAKQMTLSDLLERSAHFFHSDHQYVFSGMNGMGHIEKINKYFPKEHVIAGTCLIGTVLNKAGDVDFIGKPGAGSINLAPQVGEPDERVKEIVADFTTANINPHLNDNFYGTLLTKVVFNSVINTICTLFEIQMGQFIDYDGAEKLGKQLINEAFDVAERAGIQLLSTREEEWQTIKYVSEVTNPLHYPSMYQDMSKNRPTEVDYINGYIYDLGKKYNYEASTHDFLRNLVHLAENTRKFRQ